MKTEKRFYVKDTNLAPSNDSKKLREFAESIGYSDFDISEKQMNFLEDGDKITISYCAGGSEDDDGIHTGGEWMDITGTWKEKSPVMGLFKSDCGEYSLSVGSDMSYNGFPYKNVRIVEEKTKLKIHTVKVTQKMCDKVFYFGNMLTKLPGTENTVLLTEVDCAENGYAPFDIRFCLVSELDPERYVQKNKGLYHSNNIVRIPDNIEDPELFENETSSDFHTLFEIKQDFHTVENGYRL